MCFIIDREYPEEMVADKDIPCFKILERCSGGSLRAPIFVSFVYFSRFSFRSKRKVRSRLDLSDVERYGRIDVGLHSHSTKPKTEQYHDIFGAHVHDAYIPKGARYWYNPHRGEYVSDKLVVSRRRVKHHVCPVKK